MQILQQALTENPFTKKEYSAVNHFLFKPHLLTQLVWSPAFHPHPLMVLPLTCTPQSTTCCSGRCMAINRFVSWDRKDAIRYWQQLVARGLQLLGWQPDLCQFDYWMKLLAWGRLLKVCVKWSPISNSFFFDGSNDTIRISIFPHAFFPPNHKQGKSQFLNVTGMTHI